MLSSIAISSGKGGVGKTILAVNLSLELARNSGKTVLFDGDFGLSNAHVLLRAAPEKTLYDVLEGSISARDAIHWLPGGLGLIGGSSGATNMLDVNSDEVHSLIRAVNPALDDVSYLVVDTAAGAEDEILSTMAACERVVVVLLAQATSFLDAYSLIKAAHQEKGLEHFNIVVNMIDSAQAAEATFRRFEQANSRFMGVKLHYCGYLPRTAAIQSSVAQRIPFMTEDHSREEARAIRHITQSILDSPKNEFAGIRFQRYQSDEA